MLLVHDVLPSGIVEGPKVLERPTLNARFVQFMTGAS